MPITFDFIEDGGANKFASATNATLTNTADGVTFTLSGDSNGGLEFLYFGNSNSLPMFISDSGDNDVVTLTFQSTANPFNTRLSGTALNPIVINAGSVVGSWTVKYLTPSGTLTPTGDRTFTSFDASGSISVTAPAVTGIVFTSSNPSGFEALALKSITANEFNCFTAGTAIATVDGLKAVETLRPGDVLRTADGATTTVRWLGRQEVDVRLMHPGRVNPVCITAGALGDGLPERDLDLSADHAIAVDGLLINAGALVNGSTIFRRPEMPLDGFTYYHVETDAHDLLLAEGVAAESFIDYAGRDGFDNAADAEARTIPEMDLPRISAARQVPAHIRDRLAPAIAAE